MTRRARRGGGRRAGRLLAQLAVFLVVAELLVRLLGIDVRGLQLLVYYTDQDLEITRPSADPELRYELVPGAVKVAPISGGPKIPHDRMSARIRFKRAVGRLFGKVDEPYSPILRRKTVNSLGFRDRPRSAAKPPGVFRIVCLGGSNTYGVDVNDEETWPARLEDALNKEGKGRFEVWNAGMIAFMLSQDAALGEKIAERYDPDLILVQHFNKGRRPFLFSWPVQHFFDADPSLYAENLRFLPFRSSGLGLALMSRWRLYRTAVIAANYLPLFKTDMRDNRLELEPELNEAAFERFHRRRGDEIPMAFVSVPRFIVSERLRALGVPVIELQRHFPPGAGPEYSEIHPPPHVYRWYSEVLRRELRKEGLLTRGRSRPPARS